MKILIDINPKTEEFMVTAFINSLKVWEHKTTLIVEGEETYEPAYNGMVDQVKTTGEYAYPVLNVSRD